MHQVATINTSMKKGKPVSSILFTIVDTHRDGQKAYMERLIRSPDEGVMPLKRCYAVETPDPSRDFR
jgi:hypothetical protein